MNESTRNIKLIIGQSSANSDSQTVKSILRWYLKLRPRILLTAPMFGILTICAIIFLTRLFLTVIGDFLVNPFWVAPFAMTPSFLLDYVNGIALAATYFALEKIPSNWDKSGSRAKRALRVTGLFGGALVISFIILELTSPGLRSLAPLFAPNAIQTSASDQIQLMTPTPTATPLTLSNSPARLLTPLSGAEQERAISFISYRAPSGWKQSDKSFGTIGTSILTIFVFDKSEGTPKEAVETVIQVVAADTIIRSVYYNDTYQVDGRPSYLSWVDGSITAYNSGGDQGQEKPYKGFFAGFAHKDWIYVFSWDAFDTDTQEALNDIAVSTLHSVQTLETSQIFVPAAEPTQSHRAGAASTSTLRPTHLPEPTATPDIPEPKLQTPPTDGIDVRVVRSGVNCRTDPTLNPSNILAPVPRGARLKAIGQTPNGDWLLVQLERGEECWLRRILVSSRSVLVSLPHTVAAAQSVSSPNPTPTRAPRPTATSRPTLLPTPTSILSACVDWEAAKQFANQTKCVCGPIVDTTYASGSNGKPTFLNLGEPHPSLKRFTIVIWGSNRSSFPASPEGYYRSKNVCVTGTIELYRGVPEIEVSQPSQIDVR